MKNTKKLKINAAAKAKIAAAARARWAKIKAAHPSSTEVVAATKPTLPAIVPKLKSGNDEAVAEKFNQLYDDAQTGMRKIIALGLMAWHIKENELKHGEWGAWLYAHKPDLCRLDSETGKPKPTSQLNGYMDLAKGALEKVGIPTLQKYFAEAAKFPTIGNMPSGGFLLLHEANVPAEAKPLREKICALVDGKTQYALFSEFKQGEEQPDGSVKKKTGRLQGQGGASKEQRANADEERRQEEIKARKIKAEETADWLIEMSDDKGFGEILGTHELIVLERAMETARGFIKNGGGK